MLHVVIIEDEIRSANRLEKMLLQTEPDARIVAKLPTVSESISFFRNQPQVDLAFMDIRLSDGISFEIFKETAIETPVIFTTAYDEYAMEAFRVHGIGYLLKPVEQEQLQACLDNYKKLTRTTSSSEILQALEKIERRQQPYRSRFLVPFRDVLVPVPVKDIAYFISQFKLTYIITRDGGKHMIDETLEELEAELDPKLFKRVTRQLIVSPESIRTIHSHFNGRLKLELQPDCKEEVLLSRDKSAQFRQWLNQ